MVRLSDALLSWSTSSSGNCNLRSAWELVRSGAPICNSSKVVCHNILQPITSFFYWRLCHNRTPTSSIFNWIKKLGIPLASSCPFCLSAEESPLHLFFLCPIVAEAWAWFYDQCGASFISLRPNGTWEAITFNYYKRSLLTSGALMGIVIHVI